MSPEYPIGLTDDRRAGFIDQLQPIRQLTPIGCAAVQRTRTRIGLSALDPAQLLTTPISLVIV